MSGHDRRPLLLVLRALGLGDLLTVVPALRALADAFPRHRRVLATPAPLHPLARHTGTVHGVLDARPLAPLPGSPPPDVAVNLHGRGPRSHKVLLATGPRRLIAFGCGAVPAPEWRAEEHEVARWCRLLEESGVPADPRRLGLDPPPVPPPPGAAGATVVHPGAGSPARRWPAARWAAVAAAEAAAGRTVVVTGGAHEVALAREVASGAGLPPTAVLAGRTDVLGLAAVVAGAGRVVCGDTGVGHLATAFGRPSVVLFGPVPPSEWGPPPAGGRHLALWAGTRGDPHGDAPHPGLLAVGLDDVLAALHRLPAPAAGPRPAAAAVASGSG